jgi:hypothetical protein
VLAGAHQTPHSRREIGLGRLEFSPRCHAV